MTNCWAGELLLNMQIFRHLLYEREGCKILQWTKCWLNNFEPQCCERGWSLSKDSLHDFCKMFWSWIATRGSPKVSHWKCRWTVAKRANLVIALSVLDLGWKTPLTTFAKCAEAGLQQPKCAIVDDQCQSVLLWLSVLLILADCKSMVATLSKGWDEAVAKTAMVTLRDLKCCSSKTSPAVERFRLTD